MQKIASSFTETTEMTMDATTTTTTITTTTTTDTTKTNNKVSKNDDTKRVKKSGIVSWKNKHILNTIFMSIGFCLLFVSFNTAQNFATSVDPTLGSISFSMLYAAWLISLLGISSPITVLLGPKYAMFFSSLLYVAYMISAIELIDWVYLLCAVLLGTAGGPLWLSQGLFTQLSCNSYEIENNLKINSKLGFFNSIFTFGFQISKCVGSLLAAIIFELNGSNVLLYSILTGVTVVGASSFLLINNNLRGNDILKLNSEIEKRIKEQQDGKKHMYKKKKKKKQKKVIMTPKTDAECISVDVVSSVASSGHGSSCVTPDCEDLDFTSHTMLTPDSTSNENVDMVGSSRKTDDGCLTIDIVTVIMNENGSSNKLDKHTDYKSELAIKRESSNVGGESGVHVSGISIEMGSSNDGSIGVSSQKSEIALKFGKTTVENVVSLSPTYSDVDSDVVDSDVVVSDVGSDVGSDISSIDNGSKLVRQDSINPGLPMPKRGVSYKGILLIVQDPMFKYLVLLCLEWGVFTAWIASDFAALIIDNTLKFYILAIEGFIGGLGSIVVGYCSDKVGPLPMFAICNFALIIAFIFLYFWPIDQARVDIWIILAVLIGVGDAGYYTTIPVMFPCLLGQRSEVFAMMRFLLAIGVSGAFLYYTYFDYTTRLSINIVLSIVGSICIFVPKQIRSKLLRTKNTK